MPERAPKVRLPTDRNLRDALLRAYRSSCRREEPCYVARRGRTYRAQYWPLLTGWDLVAVVVADGGTPDARR